MLIDLFLCETLEFFRWKNGKRIPGKVKCLLNGSVLIKILIEELMLKEISEFYIKMINLCKFLLTDDGCQIPDILDMAVGSEKLV